MAAEQHRGTAVDNNITSLVQSLHFWLHISLCVIRPASVLSTPWIWGLIVRETSLYSPTQGAVQMDDAQWFLCIHIGTFLTCDACVLNKLHHPWDWDQYDIIKYVYWYFYNDLYILYWHVLYHTMLYKILLWFDVKVSFSFSTFIHLTIRWVSAYIYPNPNPFLRPNVIHWFYKSITNSS